MISKIPETDLLVIAIAELKRASIMGKIPVAERILERMNEILRRQEERIRVLEAAITETLKGQQDGKN